LFLKNIQLGYYYNSTGFVLDWGFDYFWSQGIRKKWYSGQSSILFYSPSTKTSDAYYWNYYNSGTYSFNSFGNLITAPCVGKLSAQNKWIGTIDEDM